MNTIFRFLLFATVLNFTQQIIFDYSLSFNKFNLLYQNTRIKRDGENKCPEDCVHSLTKTTVNKDPELIALAKKLQSHPGTVMSMTKNQFKTFCFDVVVPFMQCLDNCSWSSTLKVVLTKSFSSEKFMCIEHFSELYDNYECMQKTHNISFHGCDHGNCSHLNEAPLKFVLESKTALQNDDYDEFERFLSCAKPCEASIMEHHCGNNMSQLVDNDMLGIAIRSTRDMLYMVDKKEYFPEQCRQILVDTGFNTPFKVNQTNDERSGQSWLHDFSFHKFYINILLLSLFVKCVLYC